MTARLPALFEHGTALVIGEQGVLIIGRSGAGKSALALAMIEAAQASGIFSRLVGDDRVALTQEGGRLIARGHPDIAGQIEARGAGIMALEPLAGAKVDAVIRLENAPERLPLPEEALWEGHGLRLPQLILRPDQDLSARIHLVRHWLASQVR